MHTIIISYELGFSIVTRHSEADAVELYKQASKKPETIAVFLYNPEGVKQFTFCRA